MKINWFTVIAQVINFLILVWLLKKFLYKPILNAINEREKKIASQLEDAKAEKTNAKKEQDKFKQKNEEFDQQKKELMDKAIADNKEERQRLLEKTREEAIALRSKLEKGAKDAQENLNREIAQKTQQEVFAISRKTLADIASLSLEEQSVNTFIKRINELNEEERKKFISAFKSNSNPILVQSAFILPQKQQTEIKNSVTKILGTETLFQFKITPKLISGIELTANGFKLAWNISAYLNSFEKSISETIKEKWKAETEKNLDVDKAVETEKK